MIKLSLKEPEVFEAISLLNLDSARAIDLATHALSAGNSEEALIHSRRAARLYQIANTLQRAILLQRGIKEP
jgi:hypothetical protein